MGFIYKYTSPNGKSYIGQTRTTVERRRKNSYGDGYKGSPCFWNAIRYFEGLQNFSLEILEETENDSLDERERFWIRELNTLVPNGYNIDSGGQGQHNNKAVDQYNQKGEKIASFKTIAEAAEANNCHISAIHNVLSGRCKQAHGFYWTYKDQPLVIKKNTLSHRKRVYQFDLQGNLIKEFESARNADRFYGFPMGTVGNCANKNNKRKRVGQYIFTYEPELDYEYYNIRSSTTSRKTQRESSLDVPCPFKGEDIV